MSPISSSAQRPFAMRTARHHHHRPNTFCQSPAPRQQTAARGNDVASSRRTGSRPCREAFAAPREDRRGGVPTVYVILRAQRSSRNAPRVVTASSSAPGGDGSDSPPSDGSVPRGENGAGGDGAPEAEGADAVARAAYLTALAVGAAAPVAAVGLYATGNIPTHLWAVFWWSSLLGALWEAPLMVPGCLEAPGQLLEALTRPAFLLALVIWSCWDGLVALLGPWAVCSSLPGPHFQGFSWAELSVFIIVCQVQSLSVESLAAALDLWSYRSDGSKWWKARLLTVKEGRDVVLWPQLLWLAASIVIYGICLSVSWPPS